ncbi:MAG: hypothetical protein HY608_07595 [Planctomycetes bacterium]|nr:hypothetical protein [Planctomycetota bacterium]
MKKIAFVLLATASLAFPSLLSALEIGAEARLWEQSLTADIEVDKATIEGTEIDLEDTLDIDDKETVPEYRAWIEIGNSRLTGSYSKFANDGTKTLTQSIVFDGTTYAASTTVTSDMDIELADLTFESPLPFLSLGTTASINWLAGVKYLGFEGSITASGVETANKVGVPIPQIGAGVRADLLMIDVFATAKGIGYDTGDVRGKIIDAEAGAGFELGVFRVSAGYRIFDIDVDSDDAALEFQYGGPFVGAGFSL